MLGVWSAMALLALIQVPVLVRRKMWGELAAFAVLWLFATIYASLVAAAVSIPSPTKIIISIFSR
ncbi:MAG: hypothetical protein AB1700_16530 [Bacillota bacterium]